LPQYLLLLLPGSLLLLGFIGGINSLTSGALAFGVGEIPPPFFHKSIATPNNKLTAWSIHII
jgi:hypothetical protein